MEKERRKRLKNIDGALETKRITRQQYNSHADCVLKAGLTVNSISSLARVYFEAVANKSFYLYHLNKSQFKFR